MSDPRNVAHDKKVSREEHTHCFGGGSYEAEYNPDGCRKPLRIINNQAHNQVESRKFGFDRIPFFALSLSPALFSTWGRFKQNQYLWKNENSGHKTDGDAKRHKLADGIHAAKMRDE
jgi:hypothetical protein